MNNNSTKHSKVLILGSGPAGYTAAIYAARAMLKPILVHGTQPGGQMTITTDVENYPGYSKVIQGPWLMDEMKEQAKAVGTDLIEDHIESVDLSKNPFKAIGDSGKIYTADSLIISTGAQARWLNLKSEEEYKGFGVSACATCDGFFFKNQIVHVVGGGDTAMEEANFLSRFASKVYLIHRRDTFRASKPMQQRVFDNKKIEILWNTVVEEILTDDQGVTGIKVKNTVTNEVTQRETNGFFLGIGHTPNTLFLSDQIKLDQHGFIETTDGPETNIPGVFACGDVQDPFYRQAITAAGSGCMAAMKVEKFLESEGKK